MINSIKKMKILYKVLNKISLSLLLLLIAPATHKINTIGYYRKYKNLKIFKRNTVIKKRFHILINKKKYQTQIYIKKTIIINIKI
jgi:hypothetical protein